MSIISMSFLNILICGILGIVSLIANLLGWYTFRGVIMHRLSAFLSCFYSILVLIAARQNIVLVERDVVIHLSIWLIFTMFAVSASSKFLAGNKINHYDR